jgi:hypothetical protein
MILRLREASVRGKDTANIAAVGRRNIKTVSFPLFTNVKNVSWATKKALAEASLPLPVITLALGRKAFQLKPGDLFVLNYPPYDIENMIVRVLAISEESLSSERFNVTCIEDIEYVANIPAEINAEGKATRIDLPIVDFTHVQIEEPPYQAAETPNIITPFVARETGYETGYRFYVSVDGGTSYRYVSYVSTFAVYGTLEEELPQESSSDDSISVSISVDANYLETDLNAHEKNTNLILIEDEIISFAEIVAESDGTYTISDLARGLFDTEVVSHPSSTGFYARLEKIDRVKIAYLVPGNNYKFKAVPICPQSAGNLGDAMAVNYEFTNRSLCPRPVGNLSAGTYTGSDINLTWEPRVRGLTETPQHLWECDGLFEVQVWVDSVLVRTEQTTPDNQFFNSYVYTQEMDEDDYQTLYGASASGGTSGAAPVFEHITFVVYDYIDVLRYSEGRAVEVDIVSGGTTSGV